MNAWILTITLISVLGYFIKILLPDGKNKQSVLFAVSLLSILIIITPLSKIKDKDFNFNIDYQTQIELDEAFINYSEKCRKKYYLDIANTCLNKYLSINSANFIFDDTISGNPLKKIEIYFSDIVIKNNNEHINISLIIKESLSEQFSIDKESIIIYGVSDWKIKR